MNCSYKDNINALINLYLTQTKNMKRYRTSSDILALEDKLLELKEQLEGIYTLSELKKIKRELTINALMNNIKRDFHQTILVFQQHRWTKKPIVY